jgi:hypothetical protein
MKKIELRQLGIAAILLLCAVFCQGQRQQDTVKVVLLASDTAHYYNEYMQFQSCEDVGCKDTTQKHQMYVSHFKNVKEDRGNHGYGQSYWVYGYSVREKHNTDEGQIDPYHAFGYVSRDYWVHIFYLDDKKQPLKSTVIVWQSVPAK